MPLLTDEELKAFPEMDVKEVVPDYVARYWDLMALAGKEPAKVIGEDALLVDRPGFNIELLTRGSISEDAYAIDKHEVLMVMRGHWRFAWDGGGVDPGAGRHLRRAARPQAQPCAVHDRRGQPLSGHDHRRQGRPHLEGLK